MNLGSVVRCETSIRAPPPRAVQQPPTEPALERKGRADIVGAVAEGIRRMRDLYRAGGGGVRGRSEAVAAPIDSWGYSSLGHY